MAENALLNLYEGPGALRDPRLRDVRDSTAWPSLPPFNPRPSAELRRYSTPSDRTGPSEVPARELGDNLAQRNYGHALLNAVEMILGGAPIPGARRGRSGQQGSPGGTGSPFGAGAEAGRLPERGSLSGGDRGLPPSGGPQHPYTPIPGQPRTVKVPGYGEVEARPIPQIEEAARSYAESRGRPYEVPASMPPLDADRARRIAAAYEAMQHDPANPDVRRAYDAMMEETLGQYHALRNKGMEFRFNEPGQDPYKASPALGYLDMRDNGRLSVFPTLEGFGSGVKLSREQVANNPLLTDSGEKFGTRPAVMNDIFRAVHDAYGHNGPGNPFFRAPREERAWQHHASMYTPQGRPAMTSETRGQNSWVNFGPFGEQNQKASGADTVYADQKVGLMPPWTWAEGMAPRKPGGTD